MSYRAVMIQQLGLRNRSCGVLFHAGRKAVTSFSILSNYDPVDARRIAGDALERVTRLQQCVTLVS